MTALLFIAVVATGARCACLLAAFALGRREKPCGPLLGQGAVAFGVMSGYAVSAGWLAYGAVLAVLTAGCGVLWRRSSKELALEPGVER